MLQPDSVRYMNGVRVNEKIIPDTAVASKYVASWVPKGAKMKPGLKMAPIGVTIHNTNDLKGVEDDAEQYTRATWPNCNMGGVAVHYYLDDLGAWQNLREDETGWHASDGSGDGNRKTISIEVIMSSTTGEKDLKARDNAARLTAALLYKYNWNIENIYTHNHWLKKPDKIVNDGKKNCPYYLLPDWDGFKELVLHYLIEMKSSAVSYQSIEVGDTFNFKGCKQYLSANALISRKATEGEVVITKKYYEKSRHPVHAMSTSMKSGRVYGWVNLKDLESIDFKPYTVKVIADVLDYRRGPGTDYAVRGTIKDKGVYTIVAEKDGWGQLKSKIGWINLGFTRRLS